MDLNKEKLENCDFCKLEVVKIKEVEGKVVDYEKLCEYYLVQEKEMKKLVVVNEVFKVD